MQSVQETKPRFAVGDRVSIRFGRGAELGVVVEDRGPIGAEGRRFYSIRIDETGSDEAMTLELPESELQLAPKMPPLDHDEVLSYLEYGGLVALLRTNYAGGRHQSPVWLCFDSLGNVTHTFTPERGILGGEIPPPQALGHSEGDKVRLSKRRDVEKFLASFGLSAAEAERIVRKVGTAP